jgi:hypothetical protein
MNLPIYDLTRRTKGLKYLKNMWKEAAMAQFKTSQHLPGMTKYNHEKHQSG